MNQWTVTNGYRMKSRDDVLYDLYRNGWTFAAALKIEAITMIVLAYGYDEDTYQEDGMPLPLTVHTMRTQHLERRMR